ncbi:hypothetical protein ACIRRH_21965 [Kitasatospora sp. NPDC101235]|uniref:hypothetical protein n=1 Tax=Kitasatospora sp. NPDC101235 TaxID=3364101 RepID=UPI0038051DE3
MNELIFRGKDLFRPSWSTFAVPLLALAVETVIGYVKLGAFGMTLLLAGTVLIAVPAWILVLRSWSRVGADGITVNWGLGSGRTYAWQEVRWIDVRETKGNGTATYAARIHLAGGRRRSLPGLSSSTMYPGRNFEADFRRLLDWWKHSTDPAQRVQPQKQFRDRLTPTVVGVVLALVLIPVIYVVFYVLRQR